MSHKYKPSEIESKWIRKWRKAKIYRAPEKPTDKSKMYILPQLPYPSGSGLHVGHAEVYTSCDIYARYQRMMGKDVLQVIGWDSFGLPAENYAIKTNVHPKISTDKAVENFRNQIERMGCSLDWDREVGSHQQSYYKWTQWFFLLMYNQGLAYRDSQSTNWCSKCKTVLANDQVKEGNCERCDTEVVQKEMDVWYLRITDYAERLAEDLELVDWPEESIKRQQDWIGVSEGAMIRFVLSSDGEELGEKLEVYTTRPDTIYGATFMSIAPEHYLLEQYKSEIDNWEEVENYIDEVKNKTELERKMDKEKSGVELNGLVAVNPVNEELIPIFVSDYVLMSYGTGAIMGVPAHDLRDYEFAQKYSLEIVEVIQPPDAEDEPKDDEYAVYDGSGEVINSGKYNGMDSVKFKKEITNWFEKEGIGERRKMTSLRDWSVSRQRFWGAPIPMLYRPLSEEEKELQIRYMEEPEKVINLHAWGSDFSKHYHPWIDERLTELGIDSMTPNLPETKEPVFEDWYSVAEDLVKRDYKENTVLTTRSLSSIVAFKLAEKYKFRKVVLAAPVYTDKSYIDSTSKIVEPGVFKIWKKFVDREIDFNKVAANVGELMFILSSNDPYIPFEQTEEWIKEKFPFARIMRKRDSGHFDVDHGYDEFPELLNEILRPVHLDLVRVKEEDMPVLLPEDVDFMPTGRSPLTYSKKFQEGVEEKYGKGWKREVDTLDTFMCSSWYYYRYLDPKNDGAFASEEALNKWMPVDFYIGGPEHVTGHLLYSRFFTKVLYDAGYIDILEPFAFHRHQGLILGEDGRKMSKRWGNVINPTDVVERHGADTLRLYEMFMGPLEDQKVWNTKGEKGVYRFLSKVWDLGTGQKIKKLDKDGDVYVEQEKEINRLIAYLTSAIPNLKFNTSVSKFMEFINFAVKQEELDEGIWDKFLLAFAPFAPFISEELWAARHNPDEDPEKSIHLEKWPDFKEIEDLEQQIELPVQVNGKVRATILIDRDASESEVKELVSQEERLKRYLDGSEVARFIYIPDQMVSIVVKR